MKKQTILIIEDNCEILENICEILELEGYNTQSAKNGYEGLELATQSLPDLIISDILMPKMNGYDLLQSLHSKEITAHIPFIFLTAMSEQIEKEKGRNLGSNYYLIKPFLIEDLMRVVKNCLLKKESTL